MKKEVKDTVTFSAIRENKFRDLKDAARIERVKIAREQWDSFLRMSGLDAKITLEEFGYIVSIVIGDTHISGRYGDTYIGFNHNIFGRAQKHRLQLAYNKPRSVEELVNFFTKIVNEEKENEERRKRGSDQSRLSVVKWSKVIQILLSKTKGLLAKIDSIYSKGWQNRHLLDSEYPDESICDKCTGCGVFKHDGEEKECRQNGEEGYCYHRFCDYEQVGMELEEQVESIYEILSVDILTP